MGMRTGSSRTIRIIGSSFSTGRRVRLDHRPERPFPQEEAIALGFVTGSRTSSAD
jgi:hypothetical protein